MNVQHYVASFDQAMWHLVHSLGYSSAWRTERCEGWADVRYVIDFKRELVAGDLYRVESSVVRCRTSSLVTAHRLLDVTDGGVSAEVEMASVYFDLEARRGRPLPETIRIAAERLARVAADKPAEWTRSSQEW